jgi:hypothetical protein
VNNFLRQRVVPTRFTVISINNKYVSECLILKLAKFFFILKVLLYIFLHNLTHMLVAIHGGPKYKKKKCMTLSGDNPLNFVALLIRIVSSEYEGGGLFSLPL